MELNIDVLTNPKTITLNELADLSGRLRSYIDLEISKGNLDFGFVFKKDKQVMENGKKKTVVIDRGLKVVIKNHKYTDFIENCRRLDEEYEAGKRKKTQKL